MCGRYALLTPTELLARVFDLADEPDAPWTAGPPRWNVAPSQTLPIVRHSYRLGTPGIRLARWGLVPSWADDPAIGNRMINARSESAASKPSFRAAWRARRCLVPMNGFFEWADPPEGAPRNAKKQPYWVHPEPGSAAARSAPASENAPVSPADGESSVGAAPPVIAMAGLFERWKPDDAPDDEPALETFTILTTEANETLAELHHRMPVLLMPDEQRAWLDPSGPPDPDLARHALSPRPWPGVSLTPVSTRVNNPAHDRPDVLTPTDPDPPPPPAQPTLF